MKQKDRTEFPIDLIGSKLTNVIQELERIKSWIPEKDLDKYRFTFDYSNCYYEGDIPTLKLKKNLYA